MAETLVQTQGMLLEFTSKIVASHVANNPTNATEVAKLISNVHSALSTVSNSSAEPTPDRPEPAVPIKKSIMPDYIVCLEDGKKLKMLKRHLKTAFGLTPEAYRERWGLPADYPMVAPSYSKRRSSLAKEIGLGTQGRRDDED